MLHRKATVKHGDTILVHGASGGVGTVLLQLARHAGIRVIATASPRHHDTLRSLGAEPLDYHDPEVMERRLGELAPDGVAAVFDNIGGESFSRSFRQLAPGGTLVGYGTAGQLEDTGNMILTFVGIVARFGLWTLQPNHGRRATFYNFWGGKATQPQRFRRRLADDLRHLTQLLADGTIAAHIAARIPLVEAARAMALAESRTVHGKVVLMP